MDDLISRQAILKHIEKTRQSVQMMDDTHRASIVMIGMHLCEEAVRNQPSAEPERKTGKWIFKNDLKQFFCSECGVPSLTYDDVYIYSMNLPNFCEDCGADMRGDKDETD